MDPNIMKLLEDDEDDTMHSGADVEAFTAALNRDIEGDTSTSQPPPSESETGLPHGGNSTSDQLFSQWQNSCQEENINSQIKQEEPNNSQPQEQRSSEKESTQSGSSCGNQLQQLGCPQESSQPSLQQKDNPPQEQAEHNPPPFSQTSGIQVSLQEKDNQLQQKAENNAPPYSQSTGISDQKMRHPDNQQLYHNSPKMNNQQASASEPLNNQKNRSKQVPFGMLLPVIIPHLDKDRAMQLQSLYSKLRKNEIDKEAFVRLMRKIVGDQMLKQAVLSVQLQGTAHEAKAQAARDSQTGSQQLQFTDSHSFSQLHQKGHRPPIDQGQIPTATVQGQSDSSFPTPEINAQKSREMEHPSDLQGMHVSQMSSSTMATVKQERDNSTDPSRGINKQQHLNLPQTSYPMYGATISSYHAQAFSRPSISASATTLKSQTQDSQMRQTHPSQGMVSAQQGGTTQPMNMMSVHKYDMQNSNNEPKRMHGGSLPHMTSHSMLQHNPVPWQSTGSKEQKGSAGSSMAYIKQETLDHAQEQQRKSQLLGSSSSAQADQGNPASRGPIPVSGSLASPSDPIMPVHTVLSTTTPLGPGGNTKTPAKKPSVGQKKPYDALGTPPSVPSKKQKVSGAFSDQSIEQLNDVTAVSGVNLREEEEQLLAGPKEDSRASEATRKAVQEEEERLILQKTPLQVKLGKIMAKCGIKNISNDVERCLSLCVEERMRGLISNLIRVSKQRVDTERPRHRTLITSDVRRQILSMNRKAKEDWEKKQAEEAEKADGNSATDGEKDKDEGRTKTFKANKEEDDKMRTTAANVAARVAVGGDDVLSKWQLMAEQARQKRDGGIDMASATQLGKDVSRRASSTSGRTTRDNQDGENRGPSTSAASGAGRKFGRNQVPMPHKITCTISVKDVIAVMEREPQMSKSTLVYRLYEKMRTGGSASGGGSGSSVDAANE